MTNQAVITDKDRENRALEIEAEATTRDLADKNSNFVQITKPNMKDLRQLARASVPAFEVISIMVEKMNRMNAIIISQQTLSKLTGYSLVTIKRATAYLEEHRWLQIIKLGTANAYVINSAVFWTSTKQGRFAAFHAQVITSEEEQRKPIDTTLKLKHFPLLFEEEKVTLCGPDEEQGEMDL